MRHLFTRRQALASPLFALLGKILGVRPSPAQAPASSPARSPAAARLQTEIDDFDFSFLPPSDLTFALIADTHSDKRPYSVPMNPECYRPALLGAKGRNDLNDPRAAKVYDQLNANQPAASRAGESRAGFMIHLGDMVHGHPRDTRWSIQVEKVNKLLGRLEIPAYLVPGNHDIGNKLTLPLPGGGSWPGATDNPSGVYYVSEKNIEAYEQAFGSSYFHFESSGCLFVVINASVLGSGLESEKQQWQWLEKTLSTSGSSANIFLAMHSLPYWGDVNARGEGNYEIIDEPGRSRLLGLCAKHEVRAIFTGHIHHDYVRYHGSMLIAASPATSFSRDNWGLYYPLVAPTWDPARSAYCQVRVRGRRVVRQLVRTVDLLPAVTPCQENGQAPPRRLMARQTGDGVAGMTVVTVPIMRAHAGLAAPENAVSRRDAGASRADELRVAWVSGRPGQGETWLEVRFAQPQQIVRITVEPGMKALFAYQIQLHGGDGSWTEVASGRTQPPQGNRPPPPIEHWIDATEAAAVRLLVPRSKHDISVRGLGIHNPEGIDLASLPALATVSASSTAREVKVVNTAAFAQGFDLNPLYLRLDPRSTAFSAVSPVPGVFAVDPWVIESARHAKREGARLWAVLTAGRIGAPPSTGAEDAKAFQTYCLELANALPEVDVWEIDGDPRQTQAAIATLRQVATDARFAVREGIEAPDASFAVARPQPSGAEPSLPTLLLHPPFPSRRHPGLASRLAQWLATCLKSEAKIPCVSLLPGEGLLDGWDDPMHAFYTVRAFNTVLAGARPSDRHCSDAPGLETLHFASPDGRFIVVSRMPGAQPAPSAIRLLENADRAWWIDPLTSTSTQLEIDGGELQGLLFPDYPVILRLA